jgi:hypothetical protein
MLGLEHPCHLLQTVQVGLLRAAGGKGHGDDTLCDVGEVQLMAVLHGGAQDHEPRRLITAESSGWCTTPQSLVQVNLHAARSHHLAFTFLVAGILAGSA